MDLEFFSFFFFFFVCVWVCVGVCVFFFWGVLLRHREVPRLGAELELLLLAYTTATATPDL